MTRLPPDSSLPPDALDQDNQVAFDESGNGNQSSVALSPPFSPDRSHHSSFDVNPPSGQGNHVYSHLSGAAPGIALYPPSSVSNHPQAAAASDRRLSNLSPTRRARGRHRTADLPLPSTTPSAPLQISHPRTVSASAASVPCTPQVIRRLAQQNNRIRETWEAERKYLEANRERVEEVYKEERAIMEHERAAWESERKAMRDEILKLQALVADLQTKNVLLSKRADLETADKVAGTSVHLSGFDGDGGGCGPGSDATVLPRSDMSSSSNRDSRDIWPLWDRTHSISPPGSKMALSKQPEISSFIPLNSHIQPLRPPADVLAPANPEGRSPSIDVQQLHPDLEGIPIKAAAVKKTTFTDSDSSLPLISTTSSGHLSPSCEPDKYIDGLSNEHTLQVLSPEESDRLIMHAGHTPNHSITRLATMTTGKSTTTSGDSGGSTPTMTTDVGLHILSIPPEEVVQGAQVSQSQSADIRGILSTDCSEAILEPADDPKLNGPLMVRNIPAYDEEFFKQVNERLQYVSRGRDAMPSVLRDTTDAVDIASNMKDVAEVPETVAPIGSDAAHDSTSDTDKSNPDDLGDEDEVDIPLKLRPSCNFGLPFGEA